MSGDRTRSREPEPEPEKLKYDEFYDRHLDLHKRRENPFVVKEDDIPWEVAKQGKLKWYSMHAVDNAVLPETMVFKEEIAEHSGRHTHQGGLGLFGLKGKGATVVDDQRVEWEAGDFVCLPVKPGGVTHQHFNRGDPDNPAQWLAIIYQPHLERPGAAIAQKTVSKDWEEMHGAAEDAHGHDHGDEYGYHSHEGPEDPGHEHDEDDEQAVGIPSELEDFSQVNEHFEDFDYSDWLDYESPEETETLYDDLIDRRNRFRRQMARTQEKGTWGIIKRDYPDWELNPQGRMKWYLHPDLDDRSLQNLLYAVQEIPPGSRSGKQQRQGGIVHYFLEGSGHSIINGTRHDWEAGDYLGLPYTPDGHSVQHFNDDTSSSVRFVFAEPNPGGLGVDLGAGFKQIEPCPEYEA